MTLTEVNSSPMTSRITVSAGQNQILARHWGQRVAGSILFPPIRARYRLHRGTSLPRENVIDLLWPDFSPAAGAANLRKAVHYARAALGAAPAIGSHGGMLE